VLEICYPRILGQGALFTDSIEHQVNKSINFSFVDKISFFQRTFNDMILGT
jgi:hypothetical protein